ncbi:MAG TPA: FUSC family protein [Candidatus Dormibacteraeota bacterium]|nr:FUSC family protein [Candidatus Dormibacteraeota bacterium]
MAPIRTHLRRLLWRLAEPPDLLPPLIVRCIKIALACGGVWWLGPFLSLPRPFNAVLAVIILMQGHTYGSLLNALEFLLGVAAGLLLGIAAHTLLGISPPALAAVMFVCLLMGGWLKLSREGFNNQIAISALLVLASGSADNVMRLWETALGGAVGVVIATLLWPPNPVSQLRRDYRDLRARLRADIVRSLELAGRPDGAHEAEANRRDIREHSEHADAAVAAVPRAEEALRWNPWHLGRVHDLSRLEDRLRLVAYLYRTVRALARQVARTSELEPDLTTAWGAARPELHRTGSLLVQAVEHRLAGRDAQEAVGQARESLGRFAAVAPREGRAAALAAVVDDLLTDVEGWRPNKVVDPERRLVSRILRRLGRGSPSPGQPLFAEGHLEFEEVLREARRRRLTGVLTRQPRTAPALAEVAEAVGILHEHDAGLDDIPLAQVKGSERRTLDFDVSFMPRRDHVRPAWVDLYARMAEGLPIPPIDVYRVGEVYFVKHGHHRVSVARSLGWDRIRAHVVEVETRAPLGPEVTTEELLRAAEYARFLERTGLDRVRPQARLDCSQLGRYDLIEEHILGHRYFLGVERGREVPIQEAAVSWYDSVYRPLMEVAARHRLRDRLPGWTEADVYLALSKLWLELGGEGRLADPEVAARALLADPKAARAPRSRRPRPAPHRRPRWRGRRPARHLVT